MDAPHPNYDYVHRARGQLPAARHSDSRTVARGYAVGMGGRIPQIWVFFEGPPAQLDRGGAQPAERFPDHIAGLRRPRLLSGSDM